MYPPIGGLDGAEGDPFAAGDENGHNVSLRCGFDLIELFLLTRTGGRDP